MDTDVIRKFGGNLNPEKKFRNAEKKHLKAYLAGKTQFKLGSDEGHPIYYPVLSILFSKSIPK